MATLEWDYTVDAEKIRETRAALSIEGDPSEAPPSFLFSCLVVPGLQRALIDPRLSGQRSQLRLASVQARWGRPLHVGTRLRCVLSIDSQHVIGMTAYDGSDIRVELEIGLSGAPSSARADSGSAEHKEMIVDAGRSLAFAAATWDLNPVYWNHEFARSAGLKTPVAPPGLAVAWAMQVCTERLGAHPSVARFSIDSTPRPPEKITATIHTEESSGVEVSVSAQERLICSGRCSLEAIDL